MECQPGVVGLQSGARKNAAARILGDLWCRVMHSSIQWPTHGHYVCATCGRLYPVPWANIDTAPQGSIASSASLPVACGNPSPARH